LFFHILSLQNPLAFKHYSPKEVVLGRVRPPEGQGFAFGVPGAAPRDCALPPCARRVGGSFDGMED
jgi:hypothetical protein